MYIDEEELKRALEKPADYGPDLDLSSYIVEPKEEAKLEESILRRAYDVGIDLSRKDSVGNFFQVDHSVLLKAVQKKFENDVELMTMDEAIEKYDWVEDLMWKLVSPYKDKYTAFAAKNAKGGYFIRVLEGRRVYIPVQACLLLYSPSITQCIHNMIIAEEGSEAHIITGCTHHIKSVKGLHLGMTEIYVRRNAKLSFTMVHKWGSGMDVRPRTGILVEENGTMLYNYVLIGEVKTIQSYPMTVLADGSRISTNNVVYLSGNSNVDLGGGVVMKGSGSTAELLTNSVVTDKAKMVSRGSIVSEAPGTKGHISCRGLMLSDSAEISAVPSLTSKNADSELTHEAAIGKIAEEQLFYLRSRGFRLDEAESLLVRGFLDISSMGLPRHIEKAIDSIIEQTMKGF
ncbi:MAG: SufD family Fe-S cluster assembly protein [Nitrososphaerota archaeon]|nr:SufD family Fe-S cluster assembly protein [Aigarchaeota archaeon]MDW8076065.1 SufD family Fe-S cluster assembly protein [Nitrososphaerota archaeon]